MKFELFSMSAEKFYVSVKKYSFSLPGIAEYYAVVESTLDKSATFGGRGQ